VPTGFALRAGPHGRRGRQRQLLRNRDGTDAGGVAGQLFARGAGVDAGGVVPDSDRANNVAVSMAGIAIEFPTLAPGQPARTTIAAGQDLYYRINAPAGSDLAVLAALPVAGAAQIFLSDGTISTPTSYGQTVAPTTAQVSLPILDSGAGPYIMVPGLPVAGAGVPLTLSTRYTGFRDRWRQPERRCRLFLC
jgi:hypothetical protein